MTEIDWLTVAAIAICLLLSAFFSASETALTASSRAAMLRLEKQGNRDAGIVNRLMAKRERLLGAILFGNNVTNIAASTLATGVLLEVFGKTRHHLRHAGDDGSDFRVCRSAAENGGLQCAGPYGACGCEAGRKHGALVLADPASRRVAGASDVARARHAGRQNPVDPVAARGIARRRRSHAPRRRRWKRATAT